MAEESTVKGFSEIAKVLEGLAPAIQKRVMGGALRSGARVIQKEASMRVPVGTEKRVRLARKIYNRRKKTLTRIGRMSGYLKTHISIQTVKTAAGQARVKVGPARSAFYGQFVEWGTRHIRKQPFLRPAFDTRKHDALQEIARGFAKGLKREARRLTKAAGLKPSKSR